MALERSLQREISELKSSLEDAHEELDDLRRDRGGSSTKEVEKAQKAAQNVISELTLKLAEKESAMQKLEASISELDVSLRDREAKIEEQQEALRTLRDTPTGADNPSAKTSGSAQLEKQIRQLQREVTKISSEKAAIEASLEENDELLAEKDEEILRLRAGVPIPGSPRSPSATADSLETQAALQQELVQLRQQVERTDLELSAARSAHQVRWFL